LPRQAEGRYKRAPWFISSLCAGETAPIIMDCRWTYLLLAANLLTVSGSGCQLGSAASTLAPEEPRQGLTLQPPAYPDLLAPLLSFPLQDISQPSNHRPWKPDLAVLPTADVHGDAVTVHNIRDFIYQSDENYVIKHVDRTFDLKQLETVDFIVVPFQQAPLLAHTMLSFGFADGEHLGVSAEARLEIGETYSPIRGALRQYELMYVVAEERDLIARRTRHRGADVYLYPTVATPEEARELFLDVMLRVNKLARDPEFYDTLANNCTTNIVGHINRLQPGRVPYNLSVLLPGASDRLAYELGLLRTESSFEETRRRARVNDLANRYLDSPDFSERIRRR
jgi:hypothetical protein